MSFSNSDIFIMKKSMYLGTFLRDLVLLQFDIGKLMIENLGTLKIFQLINLKA